MKNILIDARLYGPKHTGIGRYTQNLLLALSKLPDFSKYNFSVLVSEYHPDLVAYRQIVVNVPHYSTKEQLHLRSIIYKLRPDLTHFTHFNKPINYYGKSVVTIHDLIKHFFKGKDTTTKNSFLYWPKYWLYLLVTYINIKNNYLITPSNFWRDYIIKHFNKDPKKIITTHEAVDPTFINLKFQSSNAPKNYILYTGNLYPHKC
jgi:glycosyltransferase involved in cell wall biosynthesis